MWVLRFSDRKEGFRYEKTAASAGDYGSKNKEEEVMGIYLGILPGIMAILGYIFYLKSVIAGHGAIIDAIQSAHREEVVKAAIDASNTKIQEDERDYSKTRGEFIRQFASSDDSNGGTPPGKL